MFYLLCGALFFIPLIGSVVFDPFISVRNLWQAKEFIVLMFLVCISCCPGRRDIFNNRPLCLLMVFLVLSSFSIPPIILKYGHENLGGLWVWRALAWCFAYFIFYQKIASLCLARDEHRALLVRCISWAAVVSAGYAYLQAAGIDQWQFVRPMEEIANPEVPGITALIGNATYLGVWLASCLPFLLMDTNWKYCCPLNFKVFFVLGAVFLCGSYFATGSAILSLVLVALYRAKSDVWLKVGLGIALFGFIGLILCFSEIRPLIHDNGRFAVWEQTFEDWRAPCVKLAVTDDMSDAQKKEVETLNKRTYTLTGRGLGSFPFIFGKKFGTPFESAHNEPLEALYSIGLIGVALLFWAVGLVLFLTYSMARQDPLVAAVHISFLVSVIVSFGTPILHIEPLRFYVASMFALLTSFIPRREKPAIHS